MTAEFGRPRRAVIDVGARGGAASERLVYGLHGTLSRLNLQLFALSFEGGSLAVPHYLPPFNGLRLSSELKKDKGTGQGKEPGSWPCAGI